MDDVPLGAGSALSVLLTALGVAENRIPRDEEERAGYYRSVLRKRQSLIVLDNAAGEAQVRPLLPGDGGSMVLITSRRSLAGLEGVHQLPLTEMPPEDAVRMLRTIVSAERAPDLDALDALADLCGHLPLAMRIAGNRLLSRPGWTVGHMAGRLADEGRRLETLSAPSVTPLSERTPRSRTGYTSARQRDHGPRPPWRRDSFIGTALRQSENLIR